MKVWARFTQDGKECLGSDAWLGPIDGRLTMPNKALIAEQALQSLRSVHPSWNGFVFYGGNEIRDAGPLNQLGKRHYQISAANAGCFSIPQKQN